jgi:hydroxyacylglutathione hydrolase
MKELNAAGPPLLCGPPGLGPPGLGLPGLGLPGLEPLPPERFRELAEDGAHVVVDLRDQLAFGAGHVPGALGIGIDGSLSTWAGWMVPGDRPILLVAEREEDVERASRALVRVGIDRIEGHLEGGMRTWRDRTYALAVLPQLSVAELAARLAAGDAPAVVDVRGDGEWAQGHLAGAVHLMGGELPQRHAELPRGPVALVCGSGYRSTVAASWLQRAGHRDVFNVTGGMGAWKRAGLPVDPQRAPEGAKR